MKKVLAMLLSTATLTGCGLFTGKIPEETLIDPVEPPMPVTEYVPVEAAYTAEEISGNFNSAFIKEALKNKDNVIISPLSAKMIVNIAALGADEGSVTQQELLNLFDYKNVNEMKGESKNLMDELNRDDGTLSLNNSYWVSERAGKLDSDYEDLLRDIFFADGYTADLTTDYFVNFLNTRVSEETNGLIEKLIDKPLDESARLVLVNTLYFNNEWKYKFEGYATFDREFYGNNGTEIVPTMHQGTIDLEYGEGNRLKSVTMPYQDGSVMNIYLPKNGLDNIADVVSALTLDELTGEFEVRRETQKVDIAMPKFECDYSGSLQEMLRLLGVNKAFDPNNAEFGGISAEEQLYISKIIQAAKIICAEEGTEAAAATMAAMETGAALVTEEPVQFIVDRPFMYEIKSPSGETLFMGVIQNFTE